VKRELIAVCLVACGRNAPNDADAISAVRRNLEWSKARLAITVDAKVTAAEMR